MRTDSTVATGVNSDLEGNFTRGVVKLGNDIIRISYVGRNNQFLRKVQVRVESNDWDVGVIYLAAEENQLDELTIVAERAMITSDIDKSSVHIGQDLLASSNNAT